MAPLNFANGVLSGDVLFIFVALLAGTLEDEKLEFEETVFLVGWNAVLGALDFFFSCFSLVI